MARADLLVTMIESAIGGDKDLLKRTIEVMAAEERAKQHHVLADRLSAYAAETFQASAESHATTPRAHLDGLLLEVRGSLEIQDLMLSEKTRVACSELIEEQSRISLLRTYNLEPRNRILLYGPPGNGKTSLAGAIANSLFVPCFLVKYDRVIGSYLGETAARLRAVFEFVADKHCVLFFDEFDAVGKERSDAHETGEIKRVVSSLLSFMDFLPSHAILVAASNHHELLDSAAWRRFQLILNLGTPQQRELEEYLELLSNRAGITLPSRRLSRRLEGLSFAEAKDFTEDVLRKHILSGGAWNMDDLVDTTLGRWSERLK